MPDLSRWLQQNGFCGVKVRDLARAGVFALATVGPAILLVSNPGLFWDDWVWAYLSHDQNFEIGKEFGVFWTGYFNNFIYSLKDYSIILHCAAFFAWIVSGVALQRTLINRQTVSRDQGYILLLLYSTSHLSLIRYINSISMYNVFIMLFWMGCAVLSKDPRSQRRQAIAFPLYFFSFYLNSLIFTFILIILYIWFSGPEWRQTIVSCRAKWLARSYGPDAGKALYGVLRDASAEVLAFSRRNAITLTAPLLFLFVRRLSLAPSSIYSDYNVVRVDSIFRALSVSIAVLAGSARSAIAIAWNVTPIFIFAVGALAGFLLLRLCALSSPRGNWSALARMGCAGFALFVVGVYPYILAGKKPDVASVYNARHILPALPGFYLLVLALIEGVTRALARLSSHADRFRDFAVAALLSLSVFYAFTFGAALWRDWLRQVAIQEFLSTSPTAHDFKMFTFVDNSEDMILGNREIFNYEYTGNIIRALGGRDHFGAPLSEYISWAPEEDIVSDPEVRTRYNLGDFQFRDKHAIVAIASKAPMRIRNLYVPIIANLSDQPILPLMSEYLRFSLWPEWVESETYVPEIYRLRDALERYRSDNNAYPLSGDDSVVPRGGRAPLAIGPTGASPPVSFNAIPGVIGKYIPDISPAYQNALGRHGYLYISDGQDYKLVLQNAMDMPYARQAFPTMIDNVRPAYGLWTKGAEGW